MGKLRSLTADEIVVQVYYASKICRVVQSYFNEVKVESSTSAYNTVLPKLDNIVFMGMGEPADNAEAVVRAANVFADRRMFSLAQSKITVSTVAPDAAAFRKLGKAPALLAWSVHAVKDSLRQELVPTTKVWYWLSIDQMMHLCVLTTLPPLIGFNGDLATRTSGGIIK